MTNTARSRNAAAERLLLERIMSTVDDELDYDAAESLMARYVDDRVAGRDVSGIEAQLEGHLRQAPESEGALRALEDMATLEAAGNLPKADDLWAELLSASNTAATVDGVASAAEAATSRRTAGPLAGVRAWLGGLSPQTMAAVPAMLLALLVITSVGWWRADSRADHNGQLMQTVAASTAMRFNKMGDGAWARVAYDPEDSHAFVWAGGLPRAADGEHYECWFDKGNGERILAQALERFHGDPAWYHLETDRLVDAYDRFVMTREPQGDVVLEVALHDATTSR